MSNPEAADACCITPPLLREPLTESAALEMARKLKALADPVRLRLFSAIASHAGGEACVCDISDGIDVARPGCITPWSPTRCVSSRPCWISVRR
jgi:ArsR family transcriptional regulator